MTRIIQITDPHIVPEGRLAYGVVDTGAALARTVAHVNWMLPRIGPVDLAIVTGDLTDFGTAEEYHRFQSIMQSLEIPWLAIPGNHDEREAMRAAFAGQDWMPDEGPIHWSVELEDFTLIGLDTNVPDTPFGYLCEASLAFLKATLARNPARPALVGLHHPPFLTGIHGMDIQNLRNAAALCEILDAERAETRLVCGHVHRYMTKLFGRTVSVIAPGTSHAVTLEQRPNAENSLTMEPGGFMLHEWRDGFVSHGVSTGPFDGPYPFSTPG